MKPEIESVDTIRKLRALVEKLGEVATAKKLQITRQTLARVLAGLPVQSGTRALLREKLK